MCPYCQETDFGIIYKAPPPGVLSGEIKNTAGIAESASAARKQAEGIAEGSQQQQAANKRKSFTADDPSVVTVGACRLMCAVYWIEIGPTNGIIFRS